MIRKIDIKRFYAENFLCFGPKGIEVDLTKQSKVILIKGDNLDNKNSDCEEDGIRSNGSGKSSLPEIIVWALYGKTIKGCITGTNKISLDAVINNKKELGKNGKPKNKKAIAEVEFGEYKVIRTRGSNKSTLKFLKLANVDNVKDSTQDEVLLAQSANEDCDDVAVPVTQSTVRDWDNAEDLTQGEMSATQKAIEEVLGLNYDSFVNLFVFTDNNSGSFLEADTKTKRSIIEDVLSLHVYNNYASSANELYNETKRNRKLFANEYDLLLKEKEACLRRKINVETQDTNWHVAKKAEIETIKSQIVLKKLELQNTDFGISLKKYEDSQVELVELNTKLSSMEEASVKFSTDMELARSKQSELRELKDNSTSSIRSLQTDIQIKLKNIETNKSLISSLTSKEDSVCDKCYSVVKKENYQHVIDSSQSIIDLSTKEAMELKLKYEEELKKQAEHTEKFQKVDELVKKGDLKLKEINNQLTTIRKRVSELSRLQKPETGVAEKLIEEQISQLEKQLEQKIVESNGDSPYVNNIKDAIMELEEKGKECDLKNALIASIIEDEKYYAFWCGGFGDQGIRKLIINDIVPSLNKKTSYWLQFLIDGKIKIIFNDALEETIERFPFDGDPFVYHAMSGGERRRLNLAVSQAFAHIMMLSCGYSPSVVFLDEVTTNIDPAGVIGVYNMIMELSKEKLVFVTTHDHDLLNMLGGHGEINLVKENGITTLVN